MSVRVCAHFVCVNIPQFSHIILQCFSEFMVFMACCVAGFHISKWRIYGEFMNTRRRWEIEELRQRLLCWPCRVALQGEREIRLAACCCSCCCCWGVIPFPWLHFAYRMHYSCIAWATHYSYATWTSAVRDLVAIIITHALSRAIEWVAHAGYEGTRGHHYHIIIYPWRGHSSTLVSYSFLSTPNR